MTTNYKRLLKNSLFWILVAMPIFIIIVSSLFYIFQGGDASYVPNITPYRSFEELLLQINKVEADIVTLNSNFNNGFISKVDYTKTFEQLSKELNVLRLLYDNSILFNEFNYGYFSSEFPHEKYNFFRLLSRINLVSSLIISAVFVFSFIGDRFRNDMWKYCFQNRKRNIVLQDCFSGLILLIVTYFISSSLIFVFSSPLYLQSENIIRSYLDSAVIIKYQKYVLTTLFGNLLLVIYFYFILSSCVLIFRKPTKTLISFTVPLLIFALPNAIVNLDKYNFFFCSTLSISNLLFSNTTIGLIVGGQIFLFLFTTSLFILSFLHFKKADLY